MVIKVSVAYICPTHVYLTVVEARLPLLWVAHRDTRIQFFDKLPHYVVRVKVAILIDHITRVMRKDIMNCQSSLHISRAWFDWLVHVVQRDIWVRISLLTKWGVCTDSTVGSLLQLQLVVASHPRKVPTHHHERHLKDELAGAENDWDPSLLNDVFNEVNCLFVVLVFKCCANDTHRRINPHHEQVQSKQR